MKEARLILEDGTIFSGKSFGSDREIGGEIVFNTSMTGYQEILTDPSYKGEIVVMTYPQIGNYGINAKDFESYTSHVNGFIVKEFSTHPANWRIKEKLAEYLKKNKIAAITGIDTRALTRRLRTKGTMKGIITTETGDTAKLIKAAREKVKKVNLVEEVTTTQSYKVGTGQRRVVLIDCGVKQNIITSLARRDCEVIVLPARVRAEEVLEYQPDGIMLSNGPGDPREVGYLVETVKDLMGERPIFGICLGHQILGLAAGGETYKLKFGHRGANHPVKDLTTGKVYITSQNHGYAIKESSLTKTELEVTHLNVNDNTVEGFKHRELPIFSVQYHPEASPGPADSHHLFDRFINLIDDNKKGRF